jgi:hypothetical protein
MGVAQLAVLLPTAALWSPRSGVCHAVRMAEWRQQGQVWGINAAVYVVVGCGDPSKSHGSSIFRSLECQTPPHRLWSGGVRLLCEVNAESSRTRSQSLFHLNPRAMRFRWISATTPVTDSNPNTPYHTVTASPLHRSRSQFSLRPTTTPWAAKQTTPKAGLKAAPAHPKLHPTTCIAQPASSTRHRFPQQCRGHCTAQATAALADGARALATLQPARSTARGGHAQGNHALASELAIRGARTLQGSIKNAGNGCKAPNYAKRSHANRQWCGQSLTGALPNHLPAAEARIRCLVRSGAGQMQ